MCIEKWKYQFGARFKGNHWTCKISDSRFCIVTVTSLTQLWFFAFSFKGGFVFRSSSEKISVSRNRCVEKFQASGCNASPSGYCGSLLFKSLANHALAFAFCDFLSEERWWEELKVFPPTNSDSSNKWNPFTDFSCFLSCRQLTSNFLKIDFCAVVIPNMCPCLLNTLPFFLSEMLNAFKEEWCWPHRSTVWMTLLAKGG